MSSAWNKALLAGACTKIGSGSTPRGGDSVYQTSGVSFIRSQNVYNGAFSVGGLTFLDDGQAEQLRGVTVLEGDVLLNITGDSVARCCTVPVEVLPARVNQHVAIIRPAADKFDPRFLGYFLISPFMQETMLSLAASGGTRKALTKEMIERFEIPQPSIETQKRISGILRGYDDLIDNNRRRMALLEDSARQLYREWFVRLRFPGHEHTPIVDGVPKGWTSGLINDLVDVQSGYAFKTGTYESSGDFGLVTIKNVQDGFFDAECNSFIVEPPKQMPNHCHLKTADILLSLTGNIGRICHVIGDSYLLNQRVAKLVPINDMPPAFCYFMFRSDEIKSQLNAISYGVAQQNLSPVNMGTLPVSIPPQSLLRMFNDVAEPLVQQSITLKLKNQKLRQARDLLLPRLMSGELAV
jgi:type I restriction enzyme S subunit